MQIKEIMSKKPDFIEPTLSIEEAAEEMWNQDIGFLLIGDPAQDRLIGVLTDRDIVMRCIAKKLNPATTTVSDIMTPKVWYCFENDELESAAKSMKNMQVRRLAVLNDKKRIVGVLSLSDIAIKSHDAKLLGEIIERIYE